MGPYCLECHCHPPGGIQMGCGPFAGRCPFTRPPALPRTVPFAAPSVPGFSPLPIHSRPGKVGRMEMWLADPPVFHRYGQGTRQLVELLSAFALTSLIGLEREIQGKRAGLRTQAIVGTSAARCTG